MNTLPATGFTRVSIHPQYEGVYPVKQAQTFQPKFSFFDGRYWRGLYDTASDAWVMRCGPVTNDVFAWFDL